MFRSASVDNISRMNRRRGSVESCLLPPDRLSALLLGLQLHTFTGPKYVSMDTLFSLVDATLYAHLVDLKDSSPDLLPGKVMQS